MQQNVMCHGKLDLILGCMFSSKTSTLLSYIERHKKLDDNIMVINHASDIRYKDDAICSHEQKCHGSLMLNNLAQVPNMSEYKQSKLIVIDEGQFFEDIRDFCIRAVDVDKKHVVVAGLDGDFKRNPFTNITSIIPLADNIIKLKALCVHCNDGTDALFSQMKEGYKEGGIGSKEKYEPVCRKHYKEIR